MRPLPTRVRVRPNPWLPGEMLVTVNVPADVGPTSALSVVRQSVRKILGDIPVETPPPDADPPLALPMLEEDRQLMFVHFRLGAPEPRIMRQAIARINTAGSSGLGDNVELLAAIPNWFGVSQQDCCGGSPASYPVPAEPFGSRVRYAPQLQPLDLADQAAEHASQNGVEVAVLDTAPEQSDIDWASTNFKDNAHLHELLDHLDSPVGSLPAGPLEAARQVALTQVSAFHSVEPTDPIDVRDHGLFVAGVVHAAAPWVRIRLIRVLNNFGVGSFHALVIAVVGLMQAKRGGQPLIINLSLGMLPALEQLPYIWFGFPIPGLPGCPPDDTLQFLPSQPSLPPPRLYEMVQRNDPAIAAAMDVLHAPLRRLTQVLQDHNCMVLAAAGNDSVFRGIDRVPRWNPRLPALYDSVLGVAAAVRPGVPARYSNRGETPTAAVRDAVATLGGELAADGVTPCGGVLGVYTAEEFPRLPGAATAHLNEGGWAEWSGTSFATPIMAGISANWWTMHASRSAQQVLDDVNGEARAGGRPNVTDLGVPGVPVRLTWLP